MTTLEGLVAAVRAADPADHLPRLVLADWYEEDGQGERAFVIRAAVQAAPLVHTHSHGHPGGCRKCKLGRKVSRWIEGEGKALFREMFGIGFEHPGIWYGGQCLYYDQNRYRVQFDRGLITQVWCPVDVWVGVDCKTCGRERKVWYSLGNGHYEHRQCPDCSPAPARGPRIAAEHPVAWFTPTDLAEPLELSGGPNAGNWFWTLRDLPQAIQPHLRHNKVFTDRVVTRYEAVRVLSEAFLAWAHAARQQTTPPPGECDGDSPNLTHECTA